MGAWFGPAAFLLFVLAAGCSRSTPPSASPAAAAAPPQAASAEGGNGEGHEHSAPHGGTLVELGEEFAHIELQLDSTTGTLTAYALDGEAEQSVRLPQSTLDVSLVVRSGQPTRITLTGVPNPLTGESGSDTSQFRTVVPALKGVAEFEGTIPAVTVRGQQFRDVAFRYPSAEHE